MSRIDSKGDMKMIVLAAMAIVAVCVAVVVISTGRGATPLDVIIVDDGEPAPPQEPTERLEPPRPPTPPKTPKTDLKGLPPTTPRRRPVPFPGGTKPNHP